MFCINALYRAIRESPRCKTTFVGDDVLGVPKSVNFVLVKRLFDFCSSSSHLQTKNRLFCGTPRTSSPTRLDLSCETNHTFNVGGDSKRSQNGLKMGVETPKGLTFCPFSQNIHRYGNPFHRSNSCLNGSCCIGSGARI